MKTAIPFRIFTLNCFALLLAGCAFSRTEQESTAKTSTQYQCLPCGQDCDKETYNQPGQCTHCNMVLVKKTTINFRSIQPSDVCDYIATHPGVVLLDVRTKEEFEGKANPNFGTLKNAINIPVQELESRLSEINALKNKEIIVYCSHSHRSPRASYLLMQNGFANVTNMSGGMSVMSDDACKK